MLLAEFMRRKNFLYKLTKLSDFDDDCKILVVIPDRRMPLGAWIRCPSLPVLWSYIKRVSGGQFDEDNVLVSWGQPLNIRIVFPLRGKNGGQYFLKRSKRGVRILYREAR